MTDRLLTDAERDRLLLAVAQRLVKGCPRCLALGYHPKVGCSTCGPLRGALQSIEVEKAHG